MAVSPPQQFGASVNRHTPKNAIGRITPTGEVTEYPVNLGPPTGITAGPDGNMWFTAGNKIGKISLVGTITEYPLPDGGSGGDTFSGEGIAAGPDGNLWFTESGASKIGRITTDGVITEYPLPKADSYPGGIAAGPDGNMWFTEPGADRIGRITPDGTVTEYARSPPPGGEDALPGRRDPAQAGAEDGRQPGPDRQHHHQHVRMCPARTGGALPALVPHGRRQEGLLITSCAIKVTTRGKLRVNTREAVRVSVFVRAKPKLSQIGSWKPGTWGKAWILRGRAARNSSGTDLTLSRGLVEGTEAAGVGIKAVRGATLSTSGVVRFPVTSVQGDVITHKGALLFSSTAGFVTLQKIALNVTTGKASAFVEASAVPTGMQITDLLIFTGGTNRIKQNGTWKNAKVALATSISGGVPPRCSPRSWVCRPVPSLRA